ncbi:lipopolysaccharide assembly protein LapA domain-containing protein [Epibacterium ulvae]|uniref:lipopolysaccharide assembly protein LapA domain-containing protein n=1 Tax=Epibacterium ulvae TaxID=1156985 RepID=UPI00249016F6|nr:lipopolysaccharide assembly protein LapA domain-containing protein [Epibacterium ulvae]
MRYLRYAVLASLAIILASIAMANRNFVDLKLMPDALAELVGVNPGISLPLFVVVIGGVGAGLMIGFLAEYLREHKHRREAGERKREARRLAREVNKLKEQKNKGKDEVLALLEDAS